MYKFSSTIALITVILSFPLKAEKSFSEKAILAGGCFWCIEADFEGFRGVRDVVSGYTGGKVLNPTYRQVASGRTGHIEAVEVTYDPTKVSYSDILDHFWRHIDPTRNDGQFCDRGLQYRPVIFYEGSKQKLLAEKSKAKIEREKPFPEEIKVELVPASGFYAAEQYHQDYSDKNPLRYRFYRYLCGRDARIEKLWGDT